MDPEIEIVLLKGGHVELCDVKVQVNGDENADLLVHRSVIKLASKIYEDCPFATTWPVDMININGVPDDRKRDVIKQWLKLAYLAAAPYSTRIEVPMPDNLRDAWPLMRAKDALNSTDHVTAYVEALRVELSVTSRDEDNEQPKRLRFGPIDLDVRGTYVLHEVSSSGEVLSSSESTYELMQVEPKQKKHVLPFRLPESAVAEFGETLCRLLKECIRVSCEVQMTGITNALLAFIQRNNNEKHANSLHRARVKGGDKTVACIHQPMLGSASTFETVFDRETMRCLPKKLLYKSFLDCILGKTATEHGLELAMAPAADADPDPAADAAANNADA